MPADVVIYTKPACPYCAEAKGLLRKKGAAYEEIDVSRDRALFLAMSQRAGGRLTVPQIFIGGQHVGGCDDLFDLDARRGLDPLLAGG